MNYFFNQITRSVGVFFRTIRAFFVRRFVGITTRLRQMTNISRNATRAANATLQAAAAATNKPTQREDYVETSRLFIAKAFLIRLAILLVVLGLAGYFLVWPFLLSHFLTARFYVQDSRIPDWSGRVIVYSDPEKTIPLYAGRLETGELQGRGEEYDEEGLLAYAGQFLDSQRSGEGTAYTGGVLCYEGQFANDLYNGSGKLYQDGVLVYEGNFADGQASGTGTAYYTSGQTAYRGQFAEGLYEGTGTAYNEEGRLLYEGSFARGMYNGSGRLYLTDETEWIDAEFQDGQPAGVVQWYKSGRLYYEGEWADSRPQGYGALYSKDGAMLYQGQFSRGTLDGAWLLELSVDELREALGDKSQTTVRDDGGFLVESSELGLSALCSFQTEEEDAQIQSLYLAAPAASKSSGWVLLLPGTGSAGLPEWPAGANQRRGTVDAVPLSGLQLDAGSYQALIVTAEDCQAACLYDVNDQAVLLTWQKPGAGVSALDLSAMGGAGTAGTEEMEAFLASLDLGSASAAGVTSENPYYGLKDPAEGLVLCTTLDQASTVLDAMLTYWEQSELQAGLEENLARTEELLAEAQTDLAAGSGAEETVTALEDQVAELNSQIQSCQAQRSLAQLQAEDAGIGDLADYAVERVPLCFDPSQTDSGQFALAATAFAQVSGTDTDQAKLAAMTSVVNLTEDYGQVQTALNRYESAQAAAQTAAGSYATGSASKADWYSALSAQADARSSLYSALAAFGREANRLNILTGGWVTQNYEWYADQLMPLFEAASDAQAAADALQPSGIRIGFITIAPEAKGENPYYGVLDPAEALAGCKTANKAVKLIDAMLSYWQQAELEVSAEESLARVEELLAEAQAAEDRQSESDLEAEAADLRAAVRDCQLQRAQDLAQGVLYGVADLSNYALDRLLIYFDPSLADSSQLTRAAMDAAEAAGESTADAKLTVMNTLASLTESYNQVQTALAEYQAAEQEAGQLAESYAAGTAAKAEWYQALTAQSEARAALCEALASFAREANRLNQATGGWLSQNYGWYSEQLTALFEAS